MAGRDKKQNTIWGGGRITAGSDALMEAINASIGFDRALWRHDIRGSRAHAAMLAACGIIAKQDGRAIADGLDKIEDEIAAGDFAFSPALEDIHMNIESRLGEIAGEAGLRLHTARSRNDQVATDLRLWLRDAIDDILAAIDALCDTLLTHAGAHSDSVMPGYTHLQAAQPVTLGHHLLAYTEMLGRDYGRFEDARARMNESPLGAAALAGTGFPIDRDATAKALGFDNPMRNSMDAVSARDFAAEFLAAAAICAVHLSRLAEEIVLWASDGFGFIRLDDGFSSGSSIMPQKRNPDAAELIRAKPGRITGALVALLMVLKALPLTYGKDMQEDKEPVFDAAEQLMLALAAMRGMLAGAEFNTAAMRQKAEAGFPTATDLADWMVRALNLPFRRAHHATAAITALAESKGVGLDGLTLADMQSVLPEITEEALGVVGVEGALAAKTSMGGTAPANVKKAVIAARAALVARQKKSRG